MFYHIKHFFDEKPTSFWWFPLGILVQSLPSLPGGGFDGMRLEAHLDKMSTQIIQRNADRKKAKLKAAQEEAAREVANQEDEDEWDFPRWNSVK